jgi:hypothetical protein
MNDQESLSHGLNGPRGLQATHASPRSQAIAAPHRPWQIALRVLIATALVLAVAKTSSREIVAWLAPGLAAALVWVADDFKVLRVEFVKDRNDTALAALAVLKRSVFLGGRAIVPDGVSPIVVSATVGTILQSALVALVLVLAWPAGLLEWLARLAIATVPIAVIVFIDTPLSMASWLWKSQVMSYEPDRFSALVAWNTFLNGGGRLALGLVAGALAIALARALMERIHRARTPRPLD